MKHSRILLDVRLGIKTLLLHKMRSLLTTLGVVFGVSSVISMLSVGEGASQQAMDQIRKLGSNNIIIRSIKPEEKENKTGGRIRMSIYGILNEDVDRIRDSLSGIRYIVPARMMRMDVDRKNKHERMRVVGTTAQWFDVLNREKMGGRNLLPEDDRLRRSVCVLTESGARKLLATEAVVGETIRIGNEVFEVVGIVRNESGGEGAQVPDKDIDIYMPFSTCNERYGEVNVDSVAGSFKIEDVKVNLLIVQMEKLESVASSAAAIESIFKYYHSQVDYEISVPLTLLRQAEATKRSFNIVLGSIAGISLLVGGIGIMNIMLASVTERTREIGIRRAIGAKRSQIVLQFLIETVVLSVAGGVIGIILGIVLPMLITAFSGMPTVLPVYGIVLAAGVSFLVGIVFGIYPAYRAAHLDPIEALRHE